MTFTPTTIYRDLIRLVHPDIHPEMKDALVKAQQVNACKSNPDALRRLGISWGFIKATPTDRTAQSTTFSWQNTTRPTINRWEKLFPKSLWEMGFMANQNYVGRGYYVRIKVGSRVSTHEVLRTTLKCVIIRYGTIEKRVQLRNIIKRIK